MKFSLCKKQYVYIGLAAISLSLAITTNVLAQELAEPQEEVSESATMTEEQTEEKTVLPVRVQNRIINLADNMINRMQAAIGRFTQINKRLDSRIEKLNSEGVSIPQAATVLGYAETELSEASGALTDMRGSVEHAVTSDNPRQAFKGVRSQFLIAAHSIRDTQTHLRTTIQLIKEAISSGSPAETGENASSTEQTL